MRATDMPRLLVKRSRSGVNDSDSPKPLLLWISERRLDGTLPRVVFRILHERV